MTDGEKAEITLLRSVSRMVACYRRVVMDANRLKRVHGTGVQRLCSGLLAISLRSVHEGRSLLKGIFFTETELVNVPFRWR